MKYFRTFPWGMQLLLFFLMVFTMLSFGSWCVTMLLPKLAGITIEDLTRINEKSSLNQLSVKLMVQGVLSISIFMVPALLYSYLSHPNLSYYLGLRKPRKVIQILLAILIMLGADPILVLLQDLISHLPFAESTKKAEEASQLMQQAYFRMPAFSDFLRTFTIMALIPAIGEELFFRGLLMRFAHQKVRTMALPIIFTAAVFSFAHANVFGFASIFVAGILLAVIYNLTGSIWCSIAAHAAFNGSQIVMAYLGNSNTAVKTFLNNNTVPVWYLIGGFVVATGAIYLLVKNKTPLAKNWSDDFDPPTALPEEPAY